MSIAGRTCFSDCSAETLLYFGKSLFRTILGGTGRRPRLYLGGLSSELVVVL